MLPIEEYLRQKKTCLWGRAFDVNDPDGRRKAAEWLTSELNQLAAFINHNGGATE